MYTSKSKSETRNPSGTEQQGIKRWEQHMKTTKGEAGERN